MKKIATRSLIVWMAMASWLFLSMAPVFVYAQTTGAALATETASAKKTTCVNGAVVPITLGVPIAGKSQVSGLGEYINTAYKYLASVVLVVAIVMVVYGGFLYLLGSANVGNIKRGQQIIKDALLGMVIVLAAFAILNVVNSNTTRFTLNPASVKCEAFVQTEGAASNRCESDSDCVSGSKCVETHFVFSTDTDVVVGSMVRTGARAGASAVGYGVGFLAGTVGSAVAGGWYAIFNIGETAKMCSTGQEGAPCDSAEDCSAGLGCLTNWNLCTKKTNLPKSAPCGPLDGTGTIINTDTTCAGDLKCVPRDRPWLEPGAISFTEGNYAICRGQVEPMLNIGAYAGNNSRVPDQFRCSSNTDCEGTGLQCIGPENPFRGNFCINDDSAGHPISVVENQTPCVSRQNITPRNCAGTSDAEYTCVYCPATGVANWTYLRIGSEAAKTEIGVCRNKTGVIGIPCRSH